MMNTIHTKWDGKGRRKVPKCINGKRHNWREGSESGRCAICGYDVFDQNYTKQTEDIKMEG